MKDSYLIRLNLGNQIFEGRQTAQPHDCFSLLHSQTLDFGGGASTQHNLVASEEMLELGIIGGLPVGAGQVRQGLYVAKRPQL